MYMNLNLRKNNKSNLNSNHMKRILTLMVALLVSFWCIATTVSGRTLIIILKQQSPTGIWPNSLDLVPLHCTYESADGTVYIDFMENVGRVSIAVSNLSTGETVYGTADSIDGSAVLYTSGKSGTYILQIGTESGDVYEGEFILN